MNLTIHKSTINPQSSIVITGSKSESNRLLLLQALYPHIKIENLSNSDDSEVMQQALASSGSVMDIHHAGTAMRFLTAYFAVQEGREVLLTGSSRMKERPIKILVDALKALGANIAYEEQEGFPPLRIKGQKLTKHQVTLQANVSSQYISALLLIGSKLENGLQLALEGQITSVPYIKMTLALLEEIGVNTHFEDKTITVNPTANSQQPITLTVESDWSSASYFYSIVALSDVGTQITLSSYKENSLQGDSALATIYKAFGVETTFQGHQVMLKKVKASQNSFSYNLIESPDIAQTIAVTAFALGISCDLFGLHTLKIKETDRLEALKTELEKFGATLSVTNESLHLQSFSGAIKSAKVATYNDHRMAMAFAPLAIKTSMEILDAGVVSKSYPGFWDDLKALGFQLSQ
ncbi:MAG TPA: hypothetical protein VKZ97_02855 [Flavobacteriaceae bacterium]|nr:hypothetical protein [Flavobacteriaceae bacterium]